MKHLFKICTSIESDMPTISVDGTVVGADVIYDHHREGGSEIQLHEIPDSIAIESPTLFVSPSLDEDCVISTAVILKNGARHIDTSIYVELEKASMACDQLTEPNELFYLLKDYDAQLIEEYGANAKSVRYEKLVNAVLYYIDQGFINDLNESWKGYFKSYLKKQETLILSKGMVTFLSDTVAYINIKKYGYVSPPIIYSTLRKTGHKIALIEYRSPHSGRVYSLGIDPITSIDKNLVFNIFDCLNTKDLYISPSNKWGGRAGVGGSPQIEGSFLSPHEIAKWIKVTI